MLVPAAILAGFAIVWLVFRPDPERARTIETYVLKGARIIDVRDPGAYRQRHIQDAENIPTDHLPHGLTPDERIIVYGQDEEESARAAQRLRDRGFAHVVDAGPMSHWPIPQPG
ncbi:MAG: rhodanese-like domain-containing protein [Myxococcota bacterium]